jgi:CheY-like chemotaxis protein
LIVEDEDNIRESVRMLLAWEGCEIITAADGSEALAQAQQASPDVMVLDLGLPSPDPAGGQFDGFAVMRWLDLRLLRRIPVVVLTARQDEAARSQAKTLGATEFLVKPFDPGDLTVAVRRAVTG